MTVITNPEIEKYLMGLAVEKDRRLLEMERIAHETNFPIVDRLVGRLLYIVTKLKKPKLIVELGSGYGYSAYWFARAMKRGKVVLIDNREEHIKYAQRVFTEAGLTRRAEFRTGDAIKIAKGYRDIDILFIDIDKHQYPDALEALKPHLAGNALILADNALWYGKVTGPLQDSSTLGIKRFNEMMFKDNDFFTSVVPLRDGVLIAYKL